MNTLAVPARSERKLRLVVSAPLYSRLTAAVCLVGLVALVGLAATSRAPLVYDEPPYLEPVALLDQYGLSVRFLKEYPQPAGLLHNVLHWTLKPLTGLRPPLVRLVNPVLLTLTIIVTYLNLRLLGSPQPLVSAVAMIGVPFLWVMAGLALTEMPSIFLTSLSVALLLWARNLSLERRAIPLMVALAGGLMLGLAFLSRPTVLVVLGAVPCLALVDWRRSWPIAAAYGVGTLLVAGPILILWRGLVPPASAVAVGASSFSVYNMILSFSYAAIVMLILAPGWFDLRRSWALAIMGTIVVLNGATGIVEIPVARAVVARLPSIFSAIVPGLAGSMMLGLAALFVISSVRHLYARRYDPAWIFVCLAMLLLVASPGKITHQFSSRYTGMASGMMVMASDPFAPPSPGRVVRPVLGMLIGMLSLLSYYALAAK